MNNILIVFNTLLALSMFFIKREQKMVLMWYSFVCLTMFPLIPTLGVILNIPVCFMLSEIFQLVPGLKKINAHWLLSILAIISISMIILYFNSPHYYIEKGLLGAVSIFVFDLAMKYFVIVYAILCVTGLKSMKSLLDATTIALVILTFFGLLNLVAGHPVFVEFMFQDSSDLTRVQEKILNDTSDNNRMRVHSMFKFAFDYGYICIVTLFMGIWGSNKKIIGKGQGWTIIICSLIGIIICACRTVYVCAIGSFAIYAMMTISKQKKHIVLILSAIVFLLFYEISAAAQDFVALILSAFDINSEVEGSSLAQRQLSYNAVLYYSQKDLLFGNGKDYFSIDLGYASGDFVDADLAGLEGVFMGLLLERGIVGILAYLIFYLTLMIQVFRMRKVDTVTSACCFSILIAYFLFANATGELGSVRPTLFITGAFLKLLLIKKANDREISKDKIRAAVTFN